MTQLAANDDVSMAGSLSRMSRCWLLLWTVAALILGGNLSSLARAQGERGKPVQDAALPDAPGVSPSDGGGQQSSTQAGTGRVFGTVVDVTGTPVPGAHVTLARHPGGEQTVTTESNGSYSFPGLPAGSFKISVSGSGFATVVLDEMQLAAGEEHAVPPVKLAIATANSEVQVVVTEQQLATEQVRAEEKQRVLGAFPNFYTSFLWEAAPLGARQKYSLGLRSIVDPVAFASAAITAGVEQAHNTFPGYGIGPGAYGKRFGAAYADAADARLIGSAILPSLLHQDPRYFYKGTGSVGSRIGYAVKEAFLCRGDNGRQQVNYSYIGGDFAAAGLSNLYRADQDRSASLTIRNGFIILAGHVASNVARELIFQRFTTNIPIYAQSKP
jgi:hypothetical protein